MNWIGRAFGRAIIYNVVREGFYQPHYHRVPHPHIGSREAKVDFVCPEGHSFSYRYDATLRPNDADLAWTRCPQCQKVAAWAALDLHIENDA